MSQTRRIGFKEGGIPIIVLNFFSAKKIRCVIGFCCKDLKSVISIQSAKDQSFHVSLLNAALQLSKQHKYIQENPMPSDHIWLGLVPFCILSSRWASNNMSMWVPMCSCTCAHTDITNWGHKLTWIKQRNSRENLAGLSQHNSITWYFEKLSIEGFSRRRFNCKSREFKQQHLCQYLPVLGHFLHHLRTHQLARESMSGWRLTATIAKTISQQQSHGPTCAGSDGSVLMFW